MNLRMKINSQRTYQHDFAFFHCFIIISALFFLVWFYFLLHATIFTKYTNNWLYMNIMYTWFCPLSILLEEHIGIACRRLRWRWNVIHSCSWLISAKQQLNIYIVNFNSPGNHQVSLLTCFFLMNNYCSRASVQSFTIFLAVIIIKDVCFNCRLRWNERHVLKINELK